MRGQTAKQIRKKVYGDFSQKEKRKYVAPNGMTAINTGKRREYLATKRIFKSLKRKSI